MLSVLETVAAVLAFASPALGAVVDSRALNPYAPSPTKCPSGSLVRNATGISKDEKNYLSKRGPKANAALKSWLSGIDSTYSNSSKIPTVALAHSGGGYRSFLISAGVVQALDARESSGDLAGLLQGITYQAGLSGGSWFLSSMYGNDYPTVSYLQQKLWSDSFAESAFLADLFDLSAQGNVAADIAAKKLAGFDVGLVDPYGRLLGYQFLLGPDGGVKNTLSGIAQGRNFSKFDVPYPIITSILVDTFEGQCLPNHDSSIMEMSPYEFGSWGPGIAAFTPSVTLGSKISNGNGVSCFKGFDNLGYAYGTSSNLFFELGSDLGTCRPNTTVASTNGTSDEDIQLVVSALQGIIGSLLDSTADTGLYATYPNPFKGYAPASQVSNTSVLSLIDGGTSNQNVPINPFIQPARNVDVLIINDNSADTSGNFPNGSAPHETYLQSLPDKLNLTKMPQFPDPDTVVAKGLNTRPSAYGCNDTSKITIVYLPNFNYTYQNAGESTFKLEYMPNETASMIQNGNAVATHNGDKAWPACLACILMKKTNTTLPSNCNACFSQYCYN